MSRPRASTRVVEGIGRLTHNTDFIELRKHLEAEFEHHKEKLVTIGSEESFLQLQGRAQQMKDILDLITPKKD